MSQCDVIFTCKMCLAYLGHRETEEKRNVIRNFSMSLFNCFDVYFSFIYLNVLRHNGILHN